MSPSPHFTYILATPTFCVYFINAIANSILNSSYIQYIFNGQLCAPQRTSPPLASNFEYPAILVPRAINSERAISYAWLCLESRSHFLRSQRYWFCNRGHKADEKQQFPQISYCCNAIRGSLYTRKRFIVRFKLIVYFSAYNRDYSPRLGRFFLVSNKQGIEPGNKIREHYGHFLPNGKYHLG